MPSITTHVLDTARGCPALNVPVTLEYLHSDQTWLTVGSAFTDDDGRASNLCDRPLQIGTYKITFQLSEYFETNHRGGFYPYASVVFTVKSTDQHHHVPLLLNPYGYTTYRGS